jgi:hypothetical protein
MTLQDLLDTLITQGAITDSRKGPIRTAVKQYAAMLGRSPTQCPPETYHLSPQARRHLIESQAPTHLGPRAIANLKDNIGWLLRKGMVLELIAPLEQPLPSWHETLYVGNHWTPGREGWKHVPRRTDAYSLRPLPAPLSAEIQQYAEWCTALYAPGRPARVKKRPVTLESTYRAIGAIAGFLVSHQQHDPQSLTLRDLTHPERVSAFVAWWVKRRGQITGTIHLWLANLKTIAQYWLKDEAAAHGIAQIRQSLGAPERVFTLEERTLSRAELDHIGQARYPFNATRLLECGHARRVQQRTRYNGNLQHYALWVQTSLIIRLMTWIPLRQRNIIGMQLGRHLSHTDGRWTIQFSGVDLKVARRDGQENRVTFEFPPHLHELLEEWLSRWRPRLIQTPECPWVFVTKHGQQWKRNWFTMHIERTTFKFGGVAVNPHMFRHIWATEYIKATRDAVGAAKWLGDKVETVMKHYAHLLDADAAIRPTQWMHAQLP